MKNYRSLENMIKSVVLREETEKDEEGGMAMAQLRSIATKAESMASMMKDDTQLDAWVQSKITTAADYIGTVHDYLMTNKEK